MHHKLIALLVTIFTVSISHAQVWTNLQNLEAKFTIKNAGITVNGKFTEVKGTVSLDQSNISASTFSGVIQAASINTGNKMRDNHLRNKSEFFNVKKFPTITMKAVKVGNKQTGGSYKVEWVITMKGKSRSLTTDVLVNNTGNATFLLTVFKVNRRDWDVGEKGVLMSDDVVITISGNLLK